MESEGKQKKEEGAKEAVGDGELFGGERRPPASARKGVGRRRVGRVRRIAPASWKEPREGREDRPDGAATSVAGRPGGVLLHGGPYRFKGSDHLIVYLNSWQSLQSTTDFSCSLWQAVQETSAP